MFTMVAIVGTVVGGGRRARSYAVRVRRIGGGKRARPRALGMHFYTVRNVRLLAAATTVVLRTLTEYHTLLHTRTVTRF